MIAYMSGVVALSPIAPIFGGYIQIYLSWKWNFALLGLIGLILLMTCIKILPETNLFKGRQNFKQLPLRYKTLLLNKSFVGTGLSAAFAFGALFSYISASPYLFLNLMGYSPELFGWIFSIAAIGYVLGSFCRES